MRLSLRKKISLYWNARAHWIFYKADTAYGLRFAAIAKIFNVPVKKIYGEKITKNLAFKKMNSRVFAFASKLQKNANLQSVA